MFILLVSQDGVEFLFLPELVKETKAELAFSPRKESSAV